MLNKSFILFFVMGMLCNRQAQAQPHCPQTTKNIDISAEMGAARDQDSIGWCYGFVGADLLSHYLFKTNAKEVKNADKNADYLSRENAVSAVGLSVIFNRSKITDFYKGTQKAKNALDLKKYFNKKNVVPEGGTIYGALTSAKQHGFCFEKDLPSEDFGYVLDTRCANKNKCNLAEMLKIIFDASPSSLTNSCQDKFSSLNNFFPNLKTKDIQNIIRYSERKWALYNLTVVSCKNTFKKNFLSEDSPVIHQHVINDPKNAKFNKKFKVVTSNYLLNTVDTILEKRTPVGIHYNANFLVHEDDLHIHPHASSIVGKRVNPKSCEIEYLLRNSWGGTCDAYNVENPKYATCVGAIKKSLGIKEIYTQTRSCREQFPPTPRNPRVACEPSNGLVIVKRSDLLKNLTTVIYLEE